MADTYEINPATGMLDHRLPNGDIISSNPSDLLSGDALDIVQEYIRHPGALTGLSVVVHETSGQTQLFVPIPESSVNSPRSAEGQELIRFTAEITLPDGTIVRADDLYSRTRPVNEIMVRTPTTEGRYTYQRREVKRDPDTGEVTGLKPGDVVLSSDEAIQRAMIGRLLTEYREQLNRALVEGMEDENGKIMDNVSEVAAFLARTASPSVMAGYLRSI